MEPVQLHYIFLVAGLNFLGILIVTYLNIASNKKHNTKEALKELMDEKVNKAVCDPAMKRIGLQIDEIKTDCKEQKKTSAKHVKTMSDMNNGLAFIVGRMNGDWDSIKNTGLNLG